MSTVFLALGSNVGDTKQHVTTAIHLLSEKIQRVQQAHLYASQAVGYTKQDDFLNTVVSGETELSPRELLDFVKDIEKKIGRVKRFRWGPREIDIDILFYDTLIYKDEALEIPHPRLHERDFVLVPLLELSPDFMHPLLQKTTTELLSNIPVQNRAVIKKL